MLRSLFLSATSVLALAACGDDDATEVCGPSDDAGDAITVSAESQVFRFASFTVAANNDCPAPAPPAGLISVTIFSQQIEPAGTGLITLCLPRPDLVEGVGVEVPLDPDNHPAEADDRAHTIDVDADLGNGCRWVLDAATPPDGTATFTGVCGDAEDARGFELALAGTVALIERCTGMPDRAVTATLAGSVVVSPE
jgi:hypothetical protein